MNGLDCYAQARAGKLLEHLKRIPKTAWNQIDENGCNYLYYASYTDENYDAARLLVLHGCDPNKENGYGESPFRCAIFCAPKILELYIATKAPPANLFDYILFGMRMVTQPTISSLHILLANGYRLKRSCVPAPYDLLLNFQRGVLKCRTATCAMLWAKKKTQSVIWDKFLLREIAYQIWATRYDQKWQRRI